MFEENPYEVSPLQSVSASSDDDDVFRGRLAVLGVIIFMIGWSLLTILLFVVTTGKNRLPVQVTRLGFTIFLATCLYAGHNWARILITIGLALGVLTTLLIFQSVIESGNYFMIGTFVVMIIGYTACCMILTKWSSVDAFMRYQRRDSVKPLTVRSLESNDTVREECPWCEELVAPHDGMCPACNRPI